MNHEIWSWFSPHSKIIPCLKSERFLKQITMIYCVSDSGQIFWLWFWFTWRLNCLIGLISRFCDLRFTNSKFSFHPQFYIRTSLRQTKQRINEGKILEKTEDESFINYRFSFSPVIIKWLKSGSILHLERFWVEKVSSLRLVDNVSCESEMTQKWENRRCERRGLKTRVIIQKKSLLLSVTFSSSLITNCQWGRNIFNLSLSDSKSYRGQRIILV